MMDMEDESASSQSEESGFRSFDNVAADAILSINYNPSGNRCAIAAADHKVRIYDCADQDSGIQPTLLEQWKAHDAEILDLQWIAFPYKDYLSTIGADHKIKIWREDHSQAPRSGRRFRCIMSQTPASHVPYTSFAFHSNNNQELYLALMTHDGLLTLLEPSEIGSLSSWRQIDQIYPFGKFSRGTEPRFGVAFHPVSQCHIYFALTSASSPNGLLSQTYKRAPQLIIRQGPSLRSQPSLTLALSAAHVLKIYFATPLPPNPYPTNMRESDLQLQEAVTVHLNHPSYNGTVPHSLINNLAWQPGLLSPHDILAFACTDGTIRIVEVIFPALKDDKAPQKGFQKAPTPSRSSSSSSSDDDNASTADGGRDRGIFSHYRRDSTSSTPAPSSHSSYTPPSRVSALGTSLTQQPPPPSRPQAPSHLIPSVREIESLTHDAHGGACWRVVWTGDGVALVSSGDNAEVVLWRREMGTPGSWEDIARGKGSEPGGFVEWSRTSREW